MIATPEFVFVHVPKTGGEFVRGVIERNFEVVWRSPDEEYHAPSSALPDHLRGGPMFAVVRDPWDWHVSRWAHTLKEGRPSPIRAKAEEGFTPYVREMKFRYPRRFRQMTQDCEILRFETLRDDLASFLSEFAPQERRQTLLEDIHDAPRVNTTAHRPYASYYDEETASLVEEHCARLIERFGYENPLTRG